MGLLDRLSYNGLHEIPRNWEMTSMDAARIQSYNESAVTLALEQQSFPTIAAQPHLPADKRQGLETSKALVRSSPSNDSRDLAIQPPTKRR